MKTLLSKRLLVVSEMPSLEHWVGKLSGVEFDFRKSEVVRWLCDQEDVMAWLLDTLRYRKVIVYDEAANRWSGRVAPESGSGRSGGRPRGYDEEVLLTVADAEPGGVVVGRRAWYAKVQEKSPMSTMTFNRMVDRLIKEGKVAMSGQFPEMKNRFPGKKSYWRAKLSTVVPDAVLEKLDTKLESRIENLRESTRITGEDMALRVETPPENA